MAIWAGGLMLVAILVTGGVIDAMSLFMQKSEVQAAADNSALGAVNELLVAANDDERLVAVATIIAESNLSKSMTGIVVSAAPVLDGAGVEVTVTADPRVFFPGVIGMTAGPVSASAIAQVSGSQICMIGLEVKTKSTLHMMKKAAITARNCAIYSNSRDKEGIKIEGNAKVTADFICSAGGVKFDQKMALDPAPVTDCPPMADPLADRPAPPVGSCDHKKFKLAKGVVKSLSPGVYCGGMEIEGTANLAAGIYIIKDGQLKVKNNGSLHGKNVGFFLTGTDALINFDKETVIELSGPRAGVMAGLLFYEDRNVLAADKTTVIELDPEGLPKPKEHRIRSDDARELVGTIYIPRNRLLVDGDKPIASKSAYTVIIAREFVLAEGPEIILNTDYSLTDVPVPAGVGNKTTKSTRLVH